MPKRPGAGRPALTEEPLVSTTFTITRQQKRAVIEAAKRARVSRSAWLRMLLDARFRDR